MNRNIILHNFWWKFTSVMLATVVWITFHNEVRLEGQTFKGINDLVGPRTATSARNPALPIAILRAARDNRAFRLEPASVDITVSGDETSIRKNLPSELQVFVDLSRAGDEPFRARVQVSLPPGTKLERVAPDEVHVELAKP